MNTQIPMDYDLYQLHQAYKKHKAIGPAYKMAAYGPIKQCSCGAWYFQLSSGGLVPVYGAVAGRYLAANPGIKASLRAYWTAVACHLPGAATWQDVLDKVEVELNEGTWGAWPAWAEY
jgi:hypothetical protein